MAVGNPVASNAQPEIFSLGEAVGLTVKRVVRVFRFYLLPRRWARM